VMRHEAVELKLLRVGSVRKHGVNASRRRAGWDPAYLLRVLGVQYDAIALGFRYFSLTSTVTAPSGMAERNRTTVVVPMISNVDASPGTHHNL